MFNQLVKTLSLTTASLLLMGTTTLSEAKLIKNNNPIQERTNDEHIVWKRAPINITLPVGKERFVSFPGKVEFGYNINLLPASILRIENDNKTLYFLAKKAFSTHRTQAKLETGEVILLDINAKIRADSNPIDIVLPKVESDHNEIRRNTNTESVSYASLTRYAVQQLYAPERLLKNTPNLTRFPMETTHLAPLFYDHSAVTMPIASWRRENLYVTALLIKNTLNQTLRLDPRLLCGNWKTASFFPQTQLAAKATPINLDTSTLFVISDRPFAQAIRSCFN